MPFPRWLPTPTGLTAQIAGVGYVLTHQPARFPRVGAWDVAVEGAYMDSYPTLADAKAAVLADVAARRQAVRAEFTRRRTA